MRVLVLILLVGLSAALRLSPKKKVGLSAALNIGEKAKTNMESDFDDISKPDAVYLEKKEMGAMMKIGRHGSDKCLSFLHIPKNAGTSIEEMSKQMVSSTHHTARHWGKLDTSLNCPGQKSCPFNFQLNGTTKQASCSKWHIPPYLDEVLAASYTSDGCETFCVTRSPYDRFYSQVKYVMGISGKTWGSKKNCTKEGFHAMAMEAISKVSENEYWQDCHMVSQSKYIYGNGKKPKFCKHQLRSENLKEEFDNLMKKFDIPLELSQTHSLDGSGPSSDPCSVSLQDRDADKKVQDWIHEYYSDDLKRFHYST